MILFQFFAFIVQAFVISFVVGTILYVVFLGISKIKNSEPLAGVAIRGFFFPFMFIPYFIFAIIANVFVSIYVRDVDPNIGDSWSIKITENTQLLTIDTLSDWHLSPAGAGESISDTIISIVVKGDLVAGQTKSGNYFIYDKVLSDYKEFKSYDGVQSRMSLHGISKLDFVSPSEYYFNERSFGDNVMLFIIFLFPLYRFYCLVKQFKIST